MQNVSNNLLYEELRRMREELRELKSIFIAEEEISEAERKEIRGSFKEVELEKGVPWRKVRGR